MTVARKLFSLVALLSMVLSLFAAPAFIAGASVKAQGSQPPDSLTREPIVATVQPANTALAPVLQAHSTSVVPDQYIVVYKAGSQAGDAVQHGAAHMKAMGGKVKHVFSFALHGFSARLPLAAVEALQRDPNVEYIAPDEVVSVNDGVGVETVQSSATWGLDRIDQRARALDGQYHYLYNGSGVNVYIIDTGIRITHSEFGGRARWGVNEVGDGNDTDCNGHGTHVAGTIGGSTYGIAKGVKLIAVKAMDCTGSGTWSDVIAAVDWVTAHHVSPAVANMSLGGPGYAPLDTAISNSIAAGVTYVVAAGNNANDACAMSPARVPKAITVGATDAFDWRAIFSNYGACVDLFAPGDYITSAWNTSDTDTKMLSGTSMASPHVAGAAALYLQAHPSAIPSAVSSALISQATTGRLGDIGPKSPNRLLYVLGVAGAPKPISPVNNAFVSTPRPTMTWNTSLNAAQYRIQIAKTYNFGTSVVQDSGLVSTLSFTSRIALADGKYYWHIRAYNAGGQAGPWSAYRLFTVDTVAPQVPVLSSPAGNAIVHGTPRFSWMTSTGANAYQFEYANDSSFTSLAYTSPRLASLSYTPPTMGPESYYWRVRARDAAGNLSNWSATRSITIVPPIPAAPVLASPKNSGVTNSTAPALSWNDVPYGANYQLQLAAVTTFLAAQSATGTGLSYTASTLANGKWYWRARAQNVNLEWGPWSATGDFTVDTVPPGMPTLYAPANNTITQGTPLFTWLATAGANAYQFQYTSQSDPSFGSPMYTSPTLAKVSHTPPTMQPGTYLWRVRARDAAGNWGIWSTARIVSIR